MNIYSIIFLSVVVGTLLGTIITRVIYERNPMRFQYPVLEWQHFYRHKQNSWPIDDDVYLVYMADNNKNELMAMLSFTKEKGWTIPENHPPMKGYYITHWAYLPKTPKH